MDRRTSTRRRVMSWITLALGLLLALVIAAYVFLRTDFFADATGRLVTGHLFKGMPFSITLDKMEGSILRDVTLRNVRILYRGGGGMEPFELFRADDVTCRFSVGSLLGASHRIDEVIVESPMLRLAVDSSGSYVLPSFGSGGFSTYGIEHFSIQNGSFIVRRPGGGTAVNAVILDGSLGSDPTGVRIAFERGSAMEASRRFIVRSLSGTVGYTRVRDSGGPAGRAEARYVFDSLAVGLEQSTLLLDGTVTGDERLFDLSVEAASADLDELARIAGYEDERWGEIAGRFVFAGIPQRLRVSGTASGIVRGYALDDLAFDVLRDGSTIAIDSVDGSMNGARVSGRGEYRTAAPKRLELMIDVERLDISKGFLANVDLPASDISGAVDATCAFEPFAASFMLDLEAGSFRGVPFKEAWIRGSYGEDTLRFAEIDLTHPGHRVSASGTVVDGDAVSFIMNADISRTSPLFSYFDIADYRADALLNGRWEGTFDAFEVRMSGACRNFEYHGTVLPETDIRLAVEKDERYRVLCDLDGRRFRAGSAVFDSLVLSLEYADEITRVKRLVLARPEFSAELRADIRSAGDSVVVQLGECECGALGARWVAAGRRTIVIAGSVARFDDVQFHSRDGAVFASGVWDTKAKALDGSVRIDRFDLALLSSAGVSPRSLEGRARGTISCRGALSDPALSVAVAMEEGRIDTFRLDTVRIAAEYGAGRCRIDSLAVESPSGALSLRGEITGMFLRRALKEGRKALDSTVVALEASCRGLRAAPLLSLARVSGISGGTLDGTLALHDSLIHPLVEFTGTIRGFSRGSMSVPEIDCGLRCDRNALDVNGTLILSESHRGAFSGKVPVKPAAFLYALDDQRPVVFDLEIPEGDFGEAVSLTNRVAEAAGRYAVRFGVTGTIANPRLSGELRIRDGSLRIAGMEERYTALNASVLIEDTLVTISHLNALRGKKGSIAAGGTVTLRGWRPSRYDLDVRLKDFAIESFSDMIAVVSGDLAVTTAVVDGRALPHITGSCRVDRSDIYYDMESAMSGGGGPTFAAPSFIAFVDLAIPGDTRLRTDDAQIELRGNVTLHHDRQGTYFRGEVDLVRGWYNLYNNKFNIRSGKLQFIVAGSVRPVVDIEAETKDPEGRRIYLTIRWHQDDEEPRLTLAHEDPGYSETEIWMMLGGGVIASEEGAGASWDAMGTAQNLAANYLERVLNAQMQGGVTIELESAAGATGEAGTADWSDTKIAVGKYLSEGLYVKYKQALSISTAREFEVEYRLSDRILLRSQLIRYSEQALAGKSSNTSDEINVDVKLRWEY